MQSRLLQETFRRTWSALGDGEFFEETFFDPKTSSNTEIGYRISSKPPRDVFVAVMSHFTFEIFLVFVVCRKTETIFLALSLVKYRAQFEQYRQHPLVHLTFIISSPP